MSDRPQQIATSAERTPQSDAGDTIEATYHTDPLCGWCFAIADELAAAKALLGSEVRWTIRMGGLVTGERVRSVSNDATYLRSGLAQVAKTSGRQATPAYFRQILDVGTWVSDSEPVCRAVLTAIELGGIDAGFIASHFLSDRLYIDGCEPDTDESIRALALTLKFDPTVFVERWQSDRMRADLADHWSATRATGLTTYPTIAVEKHGQLREVVAGYADSRTIVDRVRRAAAL